MCGISVLVDKNGRSVNPEIVSAMNTRVLHRGPDDEGLYIGKSFVLGHRRLSIIDLSPAGHQPMEYRDRSVITYNGEIYNYVEIRAQLESKGIEFHTTTDTEVLLAAYDHWGEDCVHHFNGMWAFVIFDRRRNVLFCSRDRFGVKPLHYVELGDYFAIASEVKQFLAIPGFVAKADTLSVYRYLVDSQLCVDERGFFAGVRDLRGGHSLRYDLSEGRYQVFQWYDLAAVSPDKTLNFHEASERFRELFLSAVGLRLRSDVEVGSCLSGGVDSSAIASAARKVTDSPNALRTVTCAWDDPSCDETKYQEVVTSATGFPAVVVRPDLRKLLDDGTLDRIVYHQDQPIPSASHFAEFSVFEAARANGLVVMLDGQGADEYLAGYGQFFPRFIADQLRELNLMLALRETTLRSQLRHQSLKLTGHSLFRGLVELPLRARFAPRESLGAWAGPALDDLFRTVEAPRAARSFREESLAQILHTSIPYQLHSEDRSSMFHSIESRLPFLDYRLVELCFSLPDTFKIRDGATKAVVREGLRGILPEAIRNRHDKLGFPAPEAAWARESPALVRRDLESAIDRFSSFLKAPLLSRFDDFAKGGAPYDPLFFKVVALQRWGAAFDIQAR